MLILTSICEILRQSLLQAGIHKLLIPIFCAVSCRYYLGIVKMPFRKTVKLNTAITIYKIDQGLGKSTNHHLRRQKSHDSFFRAMPTHRPSALGLMSPEFELAPMTTWKPSIAATPIGGECTPIETETSGSQRGMGCSVKHVSCSGTGRTVRGHLDRPLLK